MGKRGKPTLPKSVDWPEETVSWFEAWRESPRTDGWDKQQWNYLIETAVVHAEVFASENFGMLGELRAREAYMGVTFDQKPPKKQKQGGKATILQMVINDRADKAKKAANGR